VIFRWARGNRGPQRARRWQPGKQLKASAFLSVWCPLPARPFRITRNVLVSFLLLADLPFAGAFLKPGDFPLLSNRSRAAARAMLLAQHASKGRTEIILGVSTRERSIPHATEWRDDAQGQRRARIVSIPENMTMEQGLKALGGYSQQELTLISQQSSEPLGLGSMYMLRR
jgi:hypothetical protein